MRILIVEDQRDMAALITDRIERGGLLADRVGAIDEALEALNSYDYSVMLLDRRLPDGDGMSILPEARHIRPDLRVILVSALGSVEDRISGLEAGADDYLTKPFDADELLARVRASLRRPGGKPLPCIHIGALSFDPNSGETKVSGRPLGLHKRELLLLETLVRRAERAVKHTTIISEIYGLDEPVQASAVKMLVFRLRQRLTDAGAGVEIHSARGIGYLIRKSRG